MGTLYLVATPIGNLEDITLRAMRVLKEVSLIAAEDTRTARRLLAHFEIATPVMAYYEPVYDRHAEPDLKLAQILTALEQGDVAVISEAGTPGLSDPGYALVRAAIARDIRVVPIPGANALVAALTASGLPTDQFVYLGFLPRHKNARRELLHAVARETRTLVAYESPHRVTDALDDILAELGDREICIARELTKLFEEFFRSTVAGARDHFTANAPRGEFTLVLAGADSAQAANDPGVDTWDDARVIQAVRELIDAGMPRTEAVKRIAHQAKRDRRAVYALAL